MTRAYPHIVFSGDAFSPSALESETGLVFRDKHEVGDHRRHDGKPYEYGYALLEAPRDLGGEEQIRWLLDAAHRHRRHLSPTSGVHGRLHITYAYDKQCNLEYDTAFISRLNELDLSLSISCYQDENTFGEASEI